MWWRASPHQRATTLPLGVGARQHHKMMCSTPRCARIAPPCGRLARSLWTTPAGDRRRPGGPGRRHAVGSARTRPRARRRAPAPAIHSPAADPTARCPQPGDNSLKIPLSQLDHVGVSPDAPRGAGSVLRSPYRRKPKEVSWTRPDGGRRSSNAWAPPPAPSPPRPSGRSWASRGRSSSATSPSCAPPGTRCAPPTAATCSADPPPARAAPSPSSTPATRSPPSWRRSSRRAARCWTPRSSTGSTGRSPSTSFCATAPTSLSSWPGSPSPPPWPS